ncbi:MAG: tetratricopeptide repeat protein [Lachnospiraceae bacterium]|nr:tetratricopeptide repeat protein [Lachnospiraceae bacterium]
MDTRSSNVPRDPFHSTRTILYITACILAAIGFLILLRSVGNAAFLRGYEKGNYSEMPEALLTPLRFGDNYVIPYNLGNAAYHKGDYDRAVSCFQTALDSNPPEYDEECRIRVNLALSLCRTINFEDLDRSDDEAVSKAVQTLYTARSVLTVHECASEPVGSNDGHFEDADLLKHDIDKMLKELQDPPKPEDKQKKDKDSDKDQNQDQDNKDSTNRNQNSENGAGKEEQARQDQLREQLHQQKKDLENANGGSSDNGYIYIEGGSTSGYGDGTLW